MSQRIPCEFCSVCSRPAFEPCDTPTMTVEIAETSDNTHKLWKHVIEWMSGSTFRGLGVSSNVMVVSF